jgi:Fe-S cluster biosynthesis and repair protein YggX
MVASLVFHCTVSVCVWIISSFNGVNGVLYQNEKGHTGHNTFQNVSKDATTETTDILSTNFQRDWKRSTQGNCKAFTDVIKMSNTYTRTLSKVKVRWCMLQCISFNAMIDSVLGVMKTLLSVRSQATSDACNYARWQGSNNQVCETGWRQWIRKVNKVAFHTQITQSSKGNV